MPPVRHRMASTRSEKSVLSWLQGKRVAPRSARLGMQKLRQQRREAPAILRPLMPKDRGPASRIDEHFARLPCSVEPDCGGEQRRVADRPFDCLGLSPVRQPMADDY